MIRNKSSEPGSAPQAAEIVPAGDLDHVINRLCEISRGATMDLTLEVGEIVYREIYGGSLEALRARGPKDQSLRRLAAHPRLPFSASTLWRAVSVFEVVQRIPAVAASKHVGVTHLRAILGLPHAVQENLLSAAEQGRWTAGEVADRAALHRSRLKPGGREAKRALATSGVSKHLRGLERRLAEQIELADRDGLKGVDEGEALQISRALGRIRSLCDAIEDRLRRPAP
jgi:hypothetical protein